jgi:excisionase family DNA binding protein
MPQQLAKRDAMSSTNEQLVEDGLVPIHEAMAFLSVGRSTIYELMDKGMLPYAKIGRSRRIPRRALVKLAQLTLKGGNALPTIEGPPLY